MNAHFTVCGVISLATYYSACYWHKNNMKGHWLYASSMSGGIQNEIAKERGMLICFMLNCMGPLYRLFAGVGASACTVPFFELSE